MSDNIIEQATEQAQEEVKEDTHDKPISYLADSDTVVTSEIAKEIGVEIKETTKYNHDLKLILDYVKQKGAKTLNEVIWEVRELSNKVGKPAFGHPITKMSRFAYLYTERNKIDKELARHGTN
jgi:uncharacterized protein YoxC